MPMIVRGSAWLTSAVSQRTLPNRVRPTYCQLAGQTAFERAPRDPRRRLGGLQGERRGRADLARGRGQGRYARAVAVLALRLEARDLRRDVPRRVGDLPGPRRRRGAAVLAAC